MAHRFYIVPIVDSGEGFTARRDPAYITAAGAVVVRSISYGGEPYALVLVRVDDEGQQHAEIAAHTDVVVVPANIQNNIAVNAVDNVKAALETLNIPSDWVTTDFNYRQILRLIAGIFVFAQRYYGQNELRLFRGSFTLETRFNQLSAAERNRLTTCANSLNYDTSSLNGTSTIRQILRFMGQQFTGEFFRTPEETL